MFYQKFNFKKSRTRIRSLCKLFAGGSLYESLYPELPELIVNYNKRTAMIVLVSITLLCFKNSI
jgi:hypothetical protein